MMDDDCSLLERSSNAATYVSSHIANTTTTHCRARSIFERALEAEHRNTNLWMKYAEMEMKLKNINMARNIFDRAVAILPRINQFWFKYTYMEETLENVAGARQVFERWMEWEPSEEAWMAYIKMERRYAVLKG